MSGYLTFYLVRTNGAVDIFLFFFLSFLLPKGRPAIRDGNFPEEMISRMSEAPLPIRRKYRVSRCCSRRYPTQKNLPSRCVSRRRDVIDRQRSSDFNRPRMRFISPASCFFPSWYLCTAQSRSIIFQLQPQLFRMAFLPYVLLSLPLYPTTFFLLHQHGLSPSLRFVKETIMVCREEKLVSILPVCRRGIRWHPFAHDASPR